MAISCVSGPAEHRGTATICPNHLLAPIFFITLFQPGGADYAHLIGMSLLTFKHSFKITLIQYHC